MLPKEFEHMLQSNNNLEDCYVKLTKNRYSSIDGYLSQNNYEMEIHRNNQSLCLYLNEKNLQSIADQIYSFLKTSKDNNNESDG